MEKVLMFKKNHIANISLSSSDPRLRDLIATIGEYRLILRTDYFSSLARAIIGQQLSAKAAKTIWVRTTQTCGDIRPEIIFSLSEERLREAGVSRPKISYLKDLSDKVLTNAVNLDELCMLGNNEVISSLTGIKGIGSWTAEMFLIFSLGRLDILSVKDAGLRGAIKWLYRLKESPDSTDILEYGNAWKPYRTVASLYLWEAINRGCITD